MCLTECRRFPLLAVLSAASLLLFSGSALAEKSRADGIAFVTTAEGSPSLTNRTNGDTRPLTLHQSFSPANRLLETKHSDQCVVSFSNGVAISLGPETRVRIVAFQQEAFTSKEESFEIEPTVSKLALTLEHGSLSISADRLSPLSQISIQTKTGLVTSNDLLGHLVYRDETLILSAFDGHMTYNFPGKSTREFIAAPNGITVMPDSSDAPSIAKRHTTRLLSEMEHNQISSAQAASRRVIYLMSEETGDSLPIPTLAREITEDTKVSPRPYSYLD